MQIGNFGLSQMARAYVNAQQPHLKNSEPPHVRFSRNGDVFIRNNTAAPVPPAPTLPSPPPAPAVPAPASAPIATGALRFSGEEHPHLARSAEHPHFGGEEHPHA